MCGTIHWKAVEQCFILEPFIFRFLPLCNFGKLINFALSGVKGLVLQKSDRSAGTNEPFGSPNFDWRKLHL